MEKADAARVFINKKRQEAKDHEDARQNFCSLVGKIIKEDVFSLKTRGNEVYVSGSFLTFVLPLKKEDRNKYVHFICGSLFEILFDKETKESVYPPKEEKIWKNFDPGLMSLMQDFVENVDKIYEIYDKTFV